MSTEFLAITEGAFTPSTLLSTTIGALKGTLSVLLVLLAGYTTARLGALDHPTAKRLSRLCTALLLPCLLVARMGPALTTATLSRLWVAPVWGLASGALGYALGWAGRAAFGFYGAERGLPAWTIVACGRPNANALPLLLLQALARAGVLSGLAKTPGETTEEILARAEQVVLLNAVVQEVCTFQFAPWIMRMDREPECGVSARGRGRGRRDPSEEEGGVSPKIGGVNGHVYSTGGEDSERMGLLYGGTSTGPYGTEDVGEPMQELANRSSPRFRVREASRAAGTAAKLLAKSIAPPFWGAIIALIVGMVPTLHHAFYDTDGALHSTVTNAVFNLGSLFVVLQTFTVGSELALVPSAHPGAPALAWVLFVRFGLMPALGLGFVWATAGRGWYIDDKLVWFLLVLIPAGPSAMVLMSVAELVDVDQGAIAGYLTIAYLLSPLMAVVCSLALAVVDVTARRESGKIVN